MVLANTVKPVKFVVAILIGAIGLYTIVHWVLSLFSVWYAPYIRSDSDIGAVYMPMLFILLLSIPVGAYLGYRWVRKFSESALKPTASTLLGAVMLFTVVYWILWHFNEWYGTHTRYDSDFNPVFVYSLVIKLLSIAVGAYMGYRWARKPTG